MSDSYFVYVNYEKNGVPGVEKFINKQIHAACWLTRKKHGKDRTIITGTTTRMVSSADKCIPSPPDDFKFARFKVNMRKNRFGRMVAGRAEEMEYDE